VTKVPTRLAHRSAETVVHQAAAADSSPQGNSPPVSSPPVIYIAGSGRSGSTMLERVLGEMPGFVNVGELIDMSRRPAQQSERCGCGRRVSECPFWIAVGERAFGGWATGCLAEGRHLQRLVARQRHIPRLLATRTAGRHFQADVAAYGAWYAGLYRAIAAESGAACVVDASKWPVQALALARGGIDVRVIHLVRDVRGVAHSLSKQQVARPHALTETEFMWRNRPSGAAARWVTCQMQAEFLRGCGLPFAQVRYEDFVRRPQQVIETALAGLGVSHPASSLACIDDGSVVLGRSHGLAGNPSRFNDGKIELRSDEGWRRQMSRRDRLVVTMIGLPLLLRYGRRSRSRSGAASRLP
jgi:hypothetical protein